ncbi:keratin, type I cytoskeletal 19-like [Hypanus sabinus]|uniref:keratin, type I cytoskeletal 19-like n=1 Tax=Hypanus sabinus TaxID=79690 RepID=UPI0028C4B8D9|nr:keratin, type I cytoskeletal 19-like [Hypanus sabinus]
MSFSSFSSQSSAGAGRRTGSVILGSSSRTVRTSVAGGDSTTNWSTASVYGVSTRGSRMSTSTYGSVKGCGVGVGVGGFYSGGYSSGMLEPFAINEKLTMQNLNDRLATYLAKVRALEESNSQLELQIREFYQKQAPSTTKDLGAYWETIHDLRAQINAVLLANAKVLRQIRSDEMAARHFRTKYESELAIRREVEMDINFLSRELEELTVSGSDLESQVQSKKEEVICLKKSHEEELKSLRSQLRGTVTVDVDSGPGTDLTKILEEMREKYELMAAKNQKEAEAWFREQLAVIQQSVATNTQLVGTEKVQLNKHRRELQTVEMELQLRLGVKASLEESRQKADRCYTEQLYHLQDLLHQREAELAQIRADTRRQCDEYARLVDIKTRLEEEIATYRRLLEGEETRFCTVIVDGTVEKDREPEVITRKKIITITETLIDGQVVDSHQEVKEAII